MTRLKPPFQWFGGKAIVAPEVWRRFGTPARYIEPFAGGLAVALAAPRVPRFGEVFNDINGLLVNTWRAIRDDPVGVWRAANRPVAELELRAVHARMMERAVGLAERLENDMDYSDAELAGWWLWGQCSTHGSNWLRPSLPRSKPIPFPHGMLSPYRKDRPGYLRRLSWRLARAIITCGDWRRVLTPAYLIPERIRHGYVAVFLDPPYSHDGRDTGLYGSHDDGALSVQVRQWALEHGDNPQLRIALCGYAGEHDELERAGWTAHRWVAYGGYGNTRRRDSSVNTNRLREVVWFSPHCINPGQQLTLFDELMEVTDGDD